LDRSYRSTPDLRIGFGWVVRLIFLQKAELRKKGFDDEQIAHMTPEKAHQLLGILPPLPY
jgi:hypothetical protein